MINTTGSLQHTACHFRPIIASPLIVKYYFVRVFQTKSGLSHTCTVSLATYALKSGVALALSSKHSNLVHFLFQDTERTMGLDFDLNLFVDNLKATKPPYECPINNCGKIYKSFCGIQFHVFHYDHDNPENNSPSPQKKLTNGKKKNKWKQHHRQKNENPPLPPPELVRPRETLTYAEAQRLVEIDLEGRIHRINIYEPLEIICQDEIDNQSNTEKEEKGEKSPAAKNSKDPPKGRKEVSVSSHNIPSKLPEAQFKVIEDYVRPAHVKSRPNSYYRYIEKSSEELDEEVEYDMDEEVC